MMRNCHCFLNLTVFVSTFLRPCATTRVLGRVSSGEVKQGPEVQKTQRAIPEWHKGERRGGEEDCLMQPVRYQEPTDGPKPVLMQREQIPSTSKFNGNNDILKANY